MVEGDGLNHWQLEVMWAQQDQGSVFNIHPNPPKKDISGGFRSGGKRCISSLWWTRSWGHNPPLEHQLSDFRATPSHHTSPCLLSSPRSRGFIGGLTGSRWTCQGSSGRWAEREDELLSAPSCWAGSRGNCWSWDPAPRWDLESVPRRKKWISPKHHSLETWKSEAFEITENNWKYLKNVSNISSECQKHPQFLPPSLVLFRMCLLRQQKLFFKSFLPIAGVSLSRKVLTFTCCFVLFDL